MTKHEYDIRVARDRASVLAYVEGHPGTTVRNVAMAVFGGLAKARSPERRWARTILHELEAAGVVRRVPGYLPPVGHRTPDRWYAVD